MKLLFLSCIGFLLICSCGKEDSINYPRSYTFDHAEQNEEGLFVVDNNDDPVPIAVTTGTWGDGRQELKDDVLFFFQELFVLHEITLLDETRARIHMTVEEEVTDTIISYTREEGEIILNGLQGINLFNYNTDLDQFELCSRTQAAIPGPLVNNPGLAYNQYDTDMCRDGYQLEMYIQRMIEDYNYLIGDTLGIFITNLIYK
jgi:hypothetical protein